MSIEGQKQGRTVRESIQETDQVKETVTDAEGKIISEKMVDVADGGSGETSGESPVEPTDADLEVEAAKEGLIPADSVEVEDEDEEEEIYEGEDGEEEEGDSDEES